MKTNPRLHTLALALVSAATLWLGPPAGSAPAPAPAGGDALKPKETLWSLILKGGPVMIPLGLCSIVAIGSALERFLSLRRAKIIPQNFIAGLKARLGDGDDVDQAVAYCEQSQTPVGNIFKAGLLNLARGEDFVEKAIEDAGAREVDKLKRSLRLLAVIVTVSPLLGLLGTVYGMIGAFETSTYLGVGKAEFLARGIYEALVTTAAGLTIAIPVLFIHQYLNSRIDALVDEIDGMGLEFMEYYLSRQGRGATVP
jgi:biopolymer transport protein ExbB